MVPQLQLIMNQPHLHLYLSAILHQPMPHLLLLPHMPLLHHQPLLHINLHQPIPPVHINHHIHPVPTNQATNQPHQNLLAILVQQLNHHILVLHPYLVMEHQPQQTQATAILYQKIHWNCLNQTKVDSDLVELKLVSDLLVVHLLVEVLVNPEDQK